MLTLEPILTLKKLEKVDKLLPNPEMLTNFDLPNQLIDPKNQNSIHFYAQVNGEKLEGCSKEYVIDILRKTRGPVAITVRKTI